MAKDLIFKTDGTFDFGDSKSLSTRFNLAELKMGGRVGFKDRGSLNVSPQYKKLIELQNKHRFAPEKTRISFAGEGRFGDQVYPQQDLAEDIEILRNQIDNPPKGGGPGGNVKIDGREKPLAKQIKKVYADILKETGRKPYIAEVMERVTLDKSKTLDNKRVNIKEVLKRANLELTPGMTSQSKKTQIEKRVESLKAGSRIERVLSDADKEKLFADIRKYKSGTRVGPQQTMNIKDFAKYFPEGTSDVVISRQINRVANDMGLDFKKVSKAEELAAKKVKYDIKKAGDPNKITPIGTKEMPIHHGRMKGMKLGDKIIAISPSWNDIGPLDIKTNSVKLQNFEKARNTLGTELLTVWEEKKPGWERRVKEINALARRESDKIPKALRGLLYFETLDLETGKLKGIGGNPMRFEGKNKPGADIPFKELGKKVAKKAIKGGTTLGALTLGAAYEALGAPLGREVTLPTKAGEWLGPIQLTASGATQEMKELTDMVGSLANKKYAEGGSVEPRIPYRDGTSVAPNPPQEKSWEDTTAEWDKTLSAGGFNNDKPMYQKFGDMVDAESLALYYPALLNEAGLNVADFATRLPKVAKYLFEDVLTTPVGTGIDSLDVDNSGIHKAWTEITRPYEWSKKVPYGYGEDGIVTLDDLITNREAKMKAAGKSDWPVIAGKNIQLGAELVAPIFPGLKAATSVAKSLKNSGTQLLDSIMSQKGMNTNVIDEALTDKGMSRRDFNKIVAVGGLAAALKAAGLSDMFKVAPIKPTTAGIKILRESSTKMPAWFPQFVDKISAKMIYEGDGISKYVGTADELPGVEVTKNGENWTVAGKNEYGQDFELHYEAPGYIDAGAEGGSPVFYKGDFTANDSVPSAYVGPEDVDYDPSLLTEVDEVLGGTRQLEEFATGKEVKTPTVGENRVTQAEMKAEYDYDMWREQQADDFIDE